MSSPLVSIIVLNYKAREDTLACLKSLEHLTYPRVQVILVDNDSQDGTPEAARAAFPHVVVIESGGNLGFTGGNNIGIKRALDDGADYILLLNNDTVVAPDMLEPLVAAIETDPSVGVAGPMIYYFDAPDTIWSAGGTIDWAHGITSMVGLNEDDRFQYGDSPRKVDFVTGCALIARRAVWEKVGLLDDKFFMYYEETEWCVRATREGYGIVHVPSSMLWHKISIEARAASPRTYYYMTRNHLLFLNKGRASLKVWAYTLVQYARTWLSWTLKPKWQDKRPLRAVMVRALGDYARGRFGQVTL